MKIQLDKIKELYGDNILYEIKNNIDIISDNLSYLGKYQITNIEEIFVSYPYIFISSPDLFREKIDSFIEKLGIEYKEELEINIRLWGNLL